MKFKLGCFTDPITYIVCISNEYIMCCGGYMEHEEEKSNECINHSRPYDDGN